MAGMVLVLIILKLNIMANELKTPIRHSVIGEIISVKDINKDDYKEGKFKHDCKIVRIDPLNGSPLVDVYITNDQYNQYGLAPIVLTRILLVKLVILILILKSGHIMKKASTVSLVLTTLVL